MLIHAHQICEFLDYDPSQLGPVLAGSKPADPRVSPFRPSLVLFPSAMEGWDERIPKAEEEFRVFVDLLWVDEVQSERTKKEVWQRKLPRIKPAALDVVGSASWGWFLTWWPKENNLVGGNEKDITRAKQLLRRLEQKPTAPDGGVGYPVGFDVPMPED